MKRIFLKLFAFFKKDTTIKHLIVFLMCLTLFGGALLLIPKSTTDGFVGAAVGFFVSSLIIYAVKIVLGFFEDQAKVNFNTRELEGIYKNDENYVKEIKTKGKNTKARFIYNDLLTGLNESLEVSDNAYKEFKLDDFILGYYDKLFSAHSNSTKPNSYTIRLDDYDPEKKELTLSRSTFYNHLVTNRAIDFYFMEDVSLRKMFEFGPTLTPLSESKMSNHIGINALVFLSDGRLLIPHRDHKSTISKNKITSSIAIKLNFPSGNSIRDKITKEYLFYQNIVDNLSERTFLPKEEAQNTEKEINFLGFGRNVYEGGKPQFYFSVILKNINTEKYFALREKGIEERIKEKGGKGNLDMDKCIYAVDLNTFSFGKNKVWFKTHNKGIRHLECEQSFLCNLWHYATAFKNNNYFEAITPKN